MVKGKKVIIFDLDGTLIDSIGIWNAIDKEVIETISTNKVGNIDIGKQRDQKLKEYSKIEVAVMYDKYSDCNREEINQLSQYQFKDFEEMLNTIKEELGGETV